jgi:peptide/nickel transport system permease protein
MTVFLLRRFFTLIVILFSVPTIVFFVMRLVPADPALVVLGDQASAEAITAFRQKAGLDQPLFTQYSDFMRGLLQGNLGDSLITGKSISEQIWSVFPDTLALALAALVVGAAVGIPIGVITAVKRNGWIDFSGRVFALLGFSFPSFYLGVLLLLVFSVWLGWFPVIHSMRGDSVGEYLQKLVLPGLSLGLVQAAYVTRLTRSTMIEALSQDYVRTAFAKGLTPYEVFFKHALRNVLVIVITAMGVYTGTILGGAILTETVFNRPGLGKLLIGAIAQRDYNLIQSGLIVFSLIIVFVNLLVDLSYGLLDPRVKYA